MDKNLELRRLYTQSFDDSEAFVDYFFRKLTSPDKVVALIRDGKTVSALHLLDRRIFLRGELFEMPFVVAAATVRELRGMRLLETVMRSAFERLYNEGKTFVALYPFSHAYYRKYGFVTYTKISRKEIKYKKDDETEIMPCTPLNMLKIYNNRKEYFWLVQSLNALNNYFNVVQVRIALLALFDVKDRDVIDLKMLKRTVLYLENFHFAYNAILSGKANRLEKIYSTFAINLRKATNKAEAQTIIQTKLVEPLDQLFPTFEDFYKKFIALTYSKKDNPSNTKTKYAINKLNCYLSRKEIFEDDGSVEHLVPESDGEYSLGIGNLILLEQQLNSDAGQETYTKKQETYKKSNYTWIKDFCNKHPTWDHTMISERAVDMAKLYYSKILEKQVPEDYT